jgi:arginine exporter protein ArgO
MTSRSFFGDLVLVVFLLAQVSDGFFTYVGIATFGSRIEANPVVAWSITVLGAGIALVTMKALAAACATLLHMRQMHRTIGVLTIVYLTFAVWPWTYALWP